MYSRRNLEFRIRKHFFPNLTHFCFSQHPFAKAVHGQLSCPDSSLTLHVQFIYMFFVLIFKIRAQIHTLVSISLPLYKSKSPCCHHHIGFSCLLLLSPICFAYSSQSNNLKAKIELCYAIAYCHSVAPFTNLWYSFSWPLPLVLFHSALLLMFGLIGLSLFPGKNPKPISSSEISYILSLLFGTLFLLQSCFPYPLSFNFNITFLVHFI